MDIFATDDGFAISMMVGFKTEWNEADSSLAIWSGKKDGRKFAHVSTQPGQFIEALDEAGNVLVSGGDGDWFFAPLGKKRTILRHKKLPRPKLSKAEIDAARNTVTRYLVCDKPYHLDLPDTFAGVIAWMQGKMQEIPEACRDSARFDFDTTMEHGETYPHIEITYSEPESDKEVIHRLQIEAERARLAEEKERAKLAQLQAKYG